MTGPANGSRRDVFARERQTLWIGTEAGLVRIGTNRQPAIVPEVRGAPVGSIIEVRRPGGT